MKGFLYKLFSPLLRSLLKGKMGSKRIKGTDMWLRYPKDQHLGFLFSKEIRYEENLKLEIIPFIKPGSTLFEIGSNIGQYTLSLSALLGEKGRLIAIEPDHDNFSLLTMNCELNNIKNVTRVCKAITNSVGEMRFFKDTLTGGRSGSLMEKYTGGHYEGHFEDVQTTTYNNLVAEYGIPDFVKVDAEGAEENIFTPTTTLHPTTIYFIEVRHETISYIWNRFKQDGFRIFKMDEGLSEMQHVDEIKGLANLLIYKK